MGFIKHHHRISLCLKIICKDAEWRKIQLVRNSYKFKRRMNARTFEARMRLMQQKRTSNKMSFFVT